jgi:uncharacterized repeat protein (TIGR02543 family)
MRKLLVPIVTISALLLAFISTPAQATLYDGTNGTVDCSESGFFTITNNVVVSYNVCSGNAHIPAGVTSIGLFAFYEQAHLKNVTFADGSQLVSIGNSSFDQSSLASIAIPDSVTTIVESAFRGTRSLAAVTFGAGSKLASIEDSAFSGSSVPSIAIPDSVKTIFPNAFSEAASLTTVTFGSASELVSIGGNAFNRASALTSITIPAAVTLIGNMAFSGTTSLNSITVAPGNTRYSDLAGVLFNLDKTSLIHYAVGKTEISYEIPASVTSIEEAAFSGATLLTSVTIPDSVTSIGGYAFSGTTSLNSITVAPDNVHYSGVAGVLFNLDKTSLIHYAVGKTEISYEIPASVTSIEEAAFSGATLLTSVTIPDSVTSLRNSVFRGASALTSMTIPAGVTSIGDSVFRGASALTSITIPDSVTSIGDNAFNGASALTSMTIPAGVTSIGDSVFRGASALTSITIPAGVTPIGANAFNGASALNSVFFFGQAPSVDDSAFSGISAKAYIKSGATGFAAVGFLWKGLTVAVGVYSLDYDSNDGSAVSSRLFVTGDSVSAPTQPTKSGNTFAGWSATDGGSILTFPYSLSQTADVVLYALWTAIAVPSSPTPATNSDEEALASEEEFVPPTVSAKKKYSLKSLSKRLGVIAISEKAKTSFKVAKGSKKICTVSGKKLTTLKAGTCKVIFIVQEPKTKNDKKPKATRTVKVLVVTKKVSLV